jgi:hypothetical protein
VDGGIGYARCDIGSYEFNSLPPPCGGDCNGSVTVDELLTMVNIALNGGTGH